MAQASASTDLFQPGVHVTKICGLPRSRSARKRSAPFTSPTRHLRIPEPDERHGAGHADRRPARPMEHGSGVQQLHGDVGGGCELHVTRRTVLASDPNPLMNTVTVLYHPEGFPNDITDTATASVTIQAVTQQCTLGFWKQSQHFQFWVGFTPDQSFNTVFGTNITLNKQGKKPAIPNPTLLQALQAGGGGINDLARHAVAALLNASSLSNPSFTVAQVIQLTHDAYAAGGGAIGGWQHSLMPSSRQTAARASPQARSSHR